jgi:hypothetical protein
MKNRKLKILLALFVLVLPLGLTGCGNATTLARIGASVKQVAFGVRAEAASLRAGGLLTPAKLDALDKKATALVVSAEALEKYLNSLPGVTASNKAEVVAKVGETLSLVSALAQNADVIGLPADNLFVRILQFGNTVLQNAAIVLAAVNPPPTGVASGSGAAVPLAKVKIAIPDVPKGAEKYISK